MKDKILELVKDGYTYKEIRKELGCTLSTIAYHCKRNGIKSSHTVDRLSDVKIEEIKKLYDEIKSSTKVSKILGVSKTSVLKYIDVIKKDKLTDVELKINRVRQVVYWRIKVKNKLVEYKGGKCEKCGYNRCIDALEFHHKDPNQKDFSIGGKSWSFEKLKNEVDKCILVCANCHREIHSKIKTVRTEPH